MSYQHRLTLEQVDRKRTEALERIQQALNAIDSLDYSLSRPGFYRLVEGVERAALDLSAWQRIYNELELHGAAPGNSLGFVVANGSPFDGMELVGPFDTPEEANGWAEDNAHANDWWTTPVQSPKAWDDPVDDEEVYAEG